MMQPKTHEESTRSLAQQNKSTSENTTTQSPPEEIGGFNGPEPTRFGDWEKNGRCVDF